MNAQTVLLRLAERIDPRTKRGQEFRDSSAGNRLTVTGATNATPIVVTTSASHGLRNGDQVWISLVGGNTAANNAAATPSWFVGSVTATTFALYSDAALSTGVAGSGAYTSGGIVVPAMIGTVDGNYTRQRLLDIYNDARFVFFKVLKTYLPKNSVLEMIHDNVIDITNLQFTSGVTVNLPAAYIHPPILLTDVNDVVISVVDANVTKLMSGLQSATNRFVYEANGQLRSDYGNTYIADLSTYKLRYYGIPRWTLWDGVATTDIVSTANPPAPPTEPYVEDVLYQVLEIAEAIARSKGNAEVLSLAKSLIGVK